MAKIKLNKKKIAAAGLGLVLLAAIIAGTVKLSQDDKSSETGVSADTLTGDVQTLKTEENGVEITSGGIYELSESISDGSVVIRAGDADVRLVLDSVQINNSNGPAILVESADDVYVELRGQNSITATATEDYNGAIYSKSDIAFSGDGLLTVESTIDGIVGKDDLQIDGGVFVITAQDEGIVGKDSIKVTGGEIAISAQSHGLKTSNEEEKGNLEITGGSFMIESEVDGLHSVADVLISGGDLQISAGDDGIHADRNVQIDGGSIKVSKSYEGIEGGEITVNGGDIMVVASDDGFNAAGGSDSGAAQDPFAGDVSKILTVNGGNIFVNASGDGLDSNGNLYINGGTIFVDGPTNNGNGAIDYGDSGCEFVINGGELVAVGSSGMAVNATSSNQPTVLINLSSSYTGSLSFGGVEHAPGKSYNSVLISSSKLSVGETYDLVIDGNVVQSVTLDNMITGSGSMGMMPGPGMDQQGGRQGGPMMPSRR